MRNSRRQVLYCLTFALFLGFFSGVGPRAWSTPGSQSDPLVSKSWVDQYVAGAFAPLESRAQTLLLRLNVPVMVFHIGNSTAQVDGKDYQLDTAPTQIQGYTMLPLRFVGDNLGASVHWDGAKKQVSCKRGEQTLILPLSGSQATINGQGVAMPAPPVNQNGRVLVPARLVMETFGCQVDWFAAEKKVVIH